MKAAAVASEKTSGGDGGGGRGDASEGCGTWSRPRSKEKKSGVLQAEIVVCKKLWKKEKEDNTAWTTQSSVHVEIGL